MAYIWYIHMLYVTCIPYKIYIINAYKNCKKTVRISSPIGRPIDVVANEGILIKIKLPNSHALEQQYAGAHVDLRLSYLLFYSFIGTHKTAGTPQLITANSKE